MCCDRDHLQECSHSAISASSTRALKVAFKPTKPPAAPPGAASCISSGAAKSGRWILQSARAGTVEHCRVTDLAGRCEARRKSGCVCGARSQNATPGHSVGLTSQHRVCCCPPSQHSIPPEAQRRALARSEAQCFAGCSCCCGCCWDRSATLQQRRTAGEKLQLPCSSACSRCAETGRLTGLQPASQGTAPPPAAKHGRRQASSAFLSAQNPPCCLILRPSLQHISPCH